MSGANSLTPDEMIHHTLCASNWGSRCNCRDAPTIEQMRRELKELGWVQESLTLYSAPCGCYFRGPYRAWLEATGTHVGACVACQSGVA